MYTLATILFFLFSLFYLWVTMHGLSIYAMREYIDFPSFLVLVLLCMFMLMATKNVKNFVNAFKFVIKGNGYLPKLKELRASIDTIEMLSKSINYLIVFISAFTFIDILYHMDDLSTLGPCLAVACIVTLYGMIMQLVLLLLNMNLKGKVNEYHGEEESEQK